MLSESLSTTPNMAKQPMKVINQWKNVVNIRYVKMKGKAGSHIIPGCEGLHHSNDGIYHLNSRYSTHLVSIEFNQNSNYNII